VANETPAAQALAGLALSASLTEALLKRGVIEQADADAIVRDAASYVAAFCTDSGPEVEREALRVLTLIGRSQRDVSAAEAAPIPVAGPASS
jgi:hypothetical protein